jgi:uroporphyrin-III C-methyltransferase
VVTGTLSNGGISSDLALAAQSSATVIVLMGVTHLREIALLFENARAASEPMAVIQNATLPEQKVVTGTTSTICKLVDEKEITSPAVIVIGKVVNERELVEGLVFTEEVAFTYATQRTI